MIIHYDNTNIMSLNKVMFNRHNKIATVEKLDVQNASYVIYLGTLGQCPSKNIYSKIITYYVVFNSTTDMYGKCTGLFNVLNKLKYIKPHQTVIFYYNDLQCVIVSPSQIKKFSCEQYSLLFNKCVHNKTKFK